MVSEGVRPWGRGRSGDCDSVLVFFKLGAHQEKQGQEDQGRSGMVFAVQRKTKGQQQKGKIVSALFNTFFGEFVKAHETTTAMKRSKISCSLLSF